MDKILLREMVFYGHHGSDSAEKELGQHWEVDVEIEGDFSIPAKTDNLKDTIDYRKVYRRVKDVIENENFSLLETIAERIAEKLLDSFPAYEVVVRVKKQHPPLGGPIKYACVEIRRKRH
ncbi:dihydroneopterin aldolase [candidate division WOR-3 bacterium]|nr:dihydroneopterin aldolase [candidate division WOR-3 bacterium]